MGIKYVLLKMEQQLRGLGTFAPLNRVFFCFFDM